MTNVNGFEAKSSDAVPPGTIFALPDPTGDGLPPRYFGERAAAYLVRLARLGYAGTLTDVALAPVIDDAKVGRLDDDGFRWCVCCHLRKLYRVDRSTGTVTLKFRELVMFIPPAAAGVTILCANCGAPNVVTPKLVD